MYCELKRREQGNYAASFSSINLEILVRCKNLAMRMQFRAFLLCKIVVNQFAHDGRA